MNANARAQEIERSSPLVEHALRSIETRAQDVTESTTVGAALRAELLERVDEWCSRAMHTGHGSRLAYSTTNDGKSRGLMQMPGELKWDSFTCLNSLRDVEPTANLLLIEDEGEA